MRTHRFHTDQPLKAYTEIVLDAGSAHYLGQVLRIKPGQIVDIFDGNGGEYSALVKRLTRREVVLDVGEHVERSAESNLIIHLGQGLARGERMDFAVQKAVELGATTTTPIVTQRSVVKLDAERAERRLEHWHSVSVHASEQCGRTRIMEVKAPMALEDWVQDVSADTKLALDPTGLAEIGSVDLEGESIALLIGPEGGLTDGELHSAANAGFTRIRVGPRVLRTETATVVGLSAVQFRWGDL